MCRRGVLSGTAGGRVTRLAVVAAALLVGASGARADVVLDQSFDPMSAPPPFGFCAGVNGLNDEAQTFTVGVTGTLAQVDVKIIPVGAPQDLVVEVRPTVGGVPVESDTAVLASVRLPASGIPTSYGFLSVDVRPFAVPVTEGEVLAIVLRSDGFSGVYCWGGDVTDAYLAGQRFIRNPGTGWSAAGSVGVDLGFRTFVETSSTAVPGPDGLLLFTIGGLGLLGNGYRRRHW